MSHDAEPVALPLPRARDHDGRSGKRGRLWPWLKPGPGWALTSAALTAAAGGGLMLSAARGAIGASVASAWLVEQGVPAEITVDRLDATGFSGAVRLGPADAPDLVSERLELAFTPTLTVRSVRLVRPQLKLAYDGQRLRFGSLQRLVDQALSAKPTGAPGPDIVVENALATVSTPAGPLRVRADLRVDQGQLGRLDARLEPARIANGTLAARIDGARLLLDGFPGGARGRITITSPDARWGQSSLKGGQFSANVDLGLFGLAPTGRARIDGSLRADRLAFAGNQLEAPRVGLALNGAARGTIERLSLTGDARLDLRAASVSSGSGAVATAARARVVLADFTGSRSGEQTRADAAVQLTGRTSRLTMLGYALSGAEVEARYARLSLQAGPDGLSAKGSGALQLASTEARVGGTRLLGASAKAIGPMTLAANGPGRFSGRLELAGGLARGDAQRLAGALPVVGPRLATALTRVTVVAPQVAASGGGATGAVLLAVGAPIRAHGDGGAGLTVSQRGEARLLSFAGGRLSGAFELAGTGLGFSRLRVSSARYALSARRGGPEGSLSGEVSAALDRTDMGASELAGLSLEAPLQVSRTGGVIRAALPRCASVKLARFGETARALSADICPAAEPLLRLAAGRWTAAAQVRDAKADILPAQAALAGAAEFTAHGGAGPLRAEMVLGLIRARDLAKATRFAPLKASGPITLMETGWSGRLTLATQAGQALGAATIQATADGATGRATLDTGALVFSQNGFQPDALSPLAPKIISKLEGPLHVTGEIAWWNGGVASSSGRVETTGLDFTGPLGRVTKARAAVTLTSLLQPATPPGQVVTLDSVAWIAPLNAVRISFQLTPDALRLEGAQAGVSDGRVSLDPLILSLSPGATTRGTLHLAGVDIGALIARSTLADKLSLQAKLSGAVPFAIGPEGVRFAEGRLVADGPGRLSISRKALAGGDVKTSGVQDIAYQALENLAFDTLDAGVVSQPKGRLGLLFHINGRHDPPGAVETRIGLFDLVSGHALDKSLPLPKGTPVNLTLDTSLNFDELLTAYQNAARGRSEPVQGGGAK